MRIAVYVHGKGGNVAEADHYKALLQGYEVVGLEYKAETPWEVIPEFQAFFAGLKDYDSVLLIANSIGAYFSMMACPRVERALLISPIVNMEKLICNMMLWAGVSEEELREKGEIPTAFGETLSWEYLSYVREHPVRWNVCERDAANFMPTDILYGSADNLTPYDVACEFAQRVGASLTVMEGGEHWFHTDEQMEFLDRWVERCVDCVS